MARDKRVNSELKKQWWKVMRIWGHEVMKRPQASALKGIKVYTGLKKAFDTEH
jgi:very-short-patch-repair endonuclease